MNKLPGEKGNFGLHAIRTDQHLRRPALGALERNQYNNKTAKDFWQKVQAAAVYVT